MHLLSALSSTTSPLAMQALPLVAPATGDFAALIAGMVPAGDAATVAETGERQVAAPSGNGLPVTLAAPVSGVVVPDAVPAIATPLPVSATEAVLMVPTEAATPVAAPVQKVAPVLVAAAAVGVLADVLPEQAPVETAPSAETLAVRALQMPVPSRFAVLQPRVKRADSATPDAPPRASEDDSTDPELRTEGDAVPLVATPLAVPQPAEAVVLPVAPATDDAAKSAAPPAVEGGDVVTSEPLSTDAPPMRMAKRAGDTLPSAARRQANMAGRTLDPVRSARAAEPAMGVVTPLNTDSVVPVHVVVPPVADAAVPVAAPLTTSAAGVTPTVQRPVAAAPMAAAIGVAPPATPPLPAQPVAARAARTAPAAPAAPVVAPAVSVTPSTVLPMAPATTSALGIVPALSSVPVAPTSESVVLPTAPIAAPAAVTVPPTTPVVPASTVNAAPLASVAPGGLAGVMIDLPVSDQVSPVAAPLPLAPNSADVVPTAVAAVAPQTVIETATSGQPVEAPVPSRPALAATSSADAMSVPMSALSRTAPQVEPAAQAETAPTASASVERVAATPIPAANARPAAPTADAIVDRRPIASDAAAPVVPVAAPLSQPTVVAPPVTRIAGLPLSDATPPTEAPLSDSASVAPSVRSTVDTPTSAPAAMPPVPRIAADPVAEVAPVVDAVLRDADTLAPRSRRDDDVSIPTTGAAAAPDAAVLRPVAPTAQAAQPTLDTRQPQWVEGMIDRITTLREAAGANGSGETRIRLSPDALGNVEVAIRTGDDGKLHVHFNSDNADAGRLLAEAQPRLVQMAEARGLKLGGMQVDVGSQQSQQSQQSQRQAQDQGNAAPRAPRPATAQTDARTTRSTDRIA